MKRTFDVRLACRCGNVRGLIRGITPKTCNHGVCLCDDCQLYAAFLGDPELLDVNGGTEITQVAHNRVYIVAGQEYVACVKLYDKRMHRWYARCCNTPLANTMGSKSLFAGVVHACVRDGAFGATLDQALGPIRERVQGKFGKGELPKGTQQTVSIGLVVHLVTLLARWALTRAYQPSAFFNAGKPVVVPRVLTKSERQALV